MWKWFIEFRRNRNFTKAFEKAARQKFADGTIDVEQLAQVKRACKSPATMRKARKELLGNQEMYGGFFDELDWEAMLNYFLDNILPIIKTLIPILLMFLATEEEE